MEYSSSIPNSILTCRIWSWVSVCLAVTVYHACSCGTERGCRQRDRCDFHIRANTQGLWNVRHIPERIKAVTDLISWWWRWDSHWASDRDWTDKNRVKGGWARGTRPDWHSSGDHCRCTGRRAYGCRVSGQAGDRNRLDIKETYLICCWSRDSGTGVTFQRWASCFCR